MFKKNPNSGFFGNYSSWNEALSHSSGYNDSVILEKVKIASLKVKNGKAVYERDSVTFDKIQYSWPVLAGLLWVASLNQNKLSVLDFGGSLGSSYFQNRNFLKHIDLKWSIIEQNNFVECGKEFFEDNTLKFFNTVEQAIGITKPNLTLFSSAIEYIEKPYDIIEKIVSANIPYLIFDRTSFFKDSSIEEIITVQKVPSRIYDASYPSWILNQKKLKNFLEKRGYAMVAEFDCDDRIQLHNSDKAIVFKGFIFKK